MTRNKLRTVIFTATLGIAVAAPSAFGQSRAERADRNRDAADRAAAARYDRPADEGSNNRMARAVVTVSGTQISASGSLTYS